MSPFVASVVAISAAVIVSCVVVITHDHCNTTRTIRNYYEELQRQAIEADLARRVDDL